MLNNKNQISTLSKKISNNTFVFPKKINPKIYTKEYLNIKKNSFFKNLIFNLKKKDK